MKISSFYESGLKIPFGFSWNVWLQMMNECIISNVCDTDEKALLYVLVPVLLINWEPGEKVLYFFRL